MQWHSQMPNFLTSIVLDLKTTILFIQFQWTQLLRMGWLLVILKKSVRQNVIFLNFCILLVVQSTTVEMYKIKWFMKFKVMIKKENIINELLISRGLLLGTWLSTIWRWDFIMKSDDNINQNYNTRDYIFMLLHIFLSVYFAYIR